MSRQESTLPTSRRRRLVAVAAQGTANPDDVAAWSSDLPDAFIQCRDFGHSWRPFTARLTGENSYERTLRCSRCRTRRHQTLSYGGHTLGAAYTYPDGYQAPKGTGRLDGEARDALRLESTIRLVGKLDSQAKGA